MAYKESVIIKWERIIGLLIISPFFLPLIVSAYSDDTAHRFITEETAKYFNHYYPDFALDQGEISRLVQGSTDEDIPPRWLNHFYDPIYSRGFRGLRTSKAWAEDTNAQAGRIIDSNFVGAYFGAENDYSWERAIFDYVYSDEKRGIEAIGHTLHLIQDATVPDHTRDDAHPIWSTYEKYTKQFSQGSFSLADELIKQGHEPVVYKDLNNYFDNLANFSNKNFFSDDTILINKYIKPTIVNKKSEVLSDGKNYLFGQSLESDYLVRIKKEFNFYKNKEEESYTLISVDNKIPQDYWENLSDQAVTNGAGVIKLFFDAVEEEKRTKKLWQKNKSFATRFLEALNNNLGGLLASLPTIPSGLGAGEQASSSASISPTTTAVVDGPNLEQNEIDELWQKVQELKQQLNLILEQRQEETEERLAEQAVAISAPAQQVFSGSSGDSTQPLATTSSPVAIVPIPTVISPSDFSQAFSTSTINFVGTSSPGYVVFNDFSEIMATSTSDGGWSLSLSELPQGTTTINFYARDLEGNVSLPLAITVTINSLPTSINLNIANCSESLSLNNCLIFPVANLDLSWQVSRLGSYSYEVLKYYYDSESDNDDGFATTSVAIINNVTASTVATDYNISQDLLKEFRWQVIAREASTSEIVASSPVVSVFMHPRPVVINEISWAGTATSSLDEWFELRNFLPAQSLDLDNFFVSNSSNSWQINLSGTISAAGYYLIERESDEVISNRVANLVANWGDSGDKGFSLNSVGLKLYQRRGGEDVLIDETPVWDKSSSLPGSMERTWEDKISTDLSSWEENTECNSSDGPCALDRSAGETFGTPGIINTASIPRLW